MKFNKKHVIYWNHWLIKDELNGNQSFVSKDTFNRELKNAPFVLSSEYYQVDIMSLRDMLENECILIMEDMWSPQEFKSYKRYGELRFGSKLPKSKKGE